VAGGLVVAHPREGIARAAEAIDSGRAARPWRRLPSMHDFLTYDGGKESRARRGGPTNVSEAALVERAGRAPAAVLSLTTAAGSI
jgi:hypothetical protein